MYSGAFGPISIAIAPAPPVGLALPEAYIAISAAITTARRPVGRNTCNYISNSLCGEISFLTIPSTALNP